MQIAAQFNPSTAVSGTITIPQSSANGKMVIFNESSVSLQFNFQDGSTKYVPAWTAILLCGSFGGSNIAWSQLAILDSSSAPISMVVIETFAAHEPAPGTYPAALVRQTNIGNSIPIGTSVNNLVNDGNTPGTTIVEATPAGGLQAVLMDNTGLLTLGDTTNFDAVLTVNGSTHLASTFTGALDVFGTALTLHDGAHAISFTPTSSGNLNVAIDGGQIFQINTGGIDLNILSGGGTLTANQLALINGTNTGKISIDATGNINVDRPNGTRIFQINGGGIDLKATGNSLAANSVSTNSVNLIVGSFSRSASFSGSGLSGTITHGLGAIPDRVFVICTTAASSSSFGYSANSTSITITSGFNVSWNGWCVKF